MRTQRIYLSTTIPYVNAAPHLGHALELVQADVLARHHRLRGDQVRFQTGTDDNALKNVLAAQSQGVSVERLVARNAGAFAALRAPLAVCTDDFISTSSDPRHQPGVESLWRACAASGDLYRRSYQGRYCVGCEQFWPEPDLVAGRCPEHGTVPEPVSEQNWFFRLSRYAGRLREEIGTGRLRIRPAAFRKEVLGILRSGLADFSVSRPAARARGWGIAVPGDPAQVIYVWWDALANYLTALGYGSAGGEYQRWWAGADQRIHVVGKGVLRFHAVYWPAILLSAGLLLPSDVCVHGYLTIGGHKISKSAPAGAATATAPAELARRYGTDAVRWWLLRDVPLAGDADFGAERLVGRANDELAGVIGNLVSRVLSLVRRYCGDAPPDGAGAGTAAAAGLIAAQLAPGIPQPAAAAELAAVCAQAPGRISAALAEFDFRSASAQAVAIAAAANRYAERSEPWRLGSAALAGDRVAGRDLDAVLGVLVAACLATGSALAPFLPGLSERIAACCGPACGVSQEIIQVFPRITGK